MPVHTAYADFILAIGIKSLVIMSSNYVTENISMYYFFYQMFSYYFCLPYFLPGAENNYITGAELG